MSLVPDDRPMVDGDRLPMLLKPPKFQSHKYPRPMHLQAPMSALNGFINSMGIESPALLPCVPVEPSPTTGIHTLIPPLFQGVSNRAQYGPLLGAQPKTLDHRVFLDNSPVSKPGKQSAANDDGYQWRKYGEKIVKGSPFPRSYYKCSHPGCQAKKIVERRDDNIKGKIDYKGVHNHAKPSTPRGLRPKPKTKEEEDAAGCMPTYNIGVPSPVSARRTLIPIPDNLRTRLDTRQRLLDGRGFDEFDDWDGEEDDEDDDDDEDEMEFPEPELKTAQNDARAASKALEALRKANASANNRQAILALEDLGMPLLGQNDAPSISQAEPLYRPLSQSLFPSSGPAKRENNDPLQVLADEAEREAFRGVTVRQFGLSLGSAMTASSGGEPPNKKPRLAFSGPAPAMLASALQELAGGRLPLDEGKGPTTQTIADNEHYDDGFKWRKYGQKTVKSNPHPRSYYKCTFPGCNMRKHVERSPLDTNKLVITYEGQHNHAPPNGSNRTAPRRLSNGEMEARASTSPSPKPRFMLYSNRNPFTNFVNSRSPQQGSSPSIGRPNPMGPAQLPRNPFSPLQRHHSGGQATPPKLGMGLHDDPSPNHREHSGQQQGPPGYMPSPHPLAQYGQHGPGQRSMAMPDMLDHPRPSHLGPGGSQGPAYKRAKMPPALQLNLGEDPLDAALGLQSLPSFLPSGLSPAPGSLHPAHHGRQFEGGEAAHPLHQFADSMIQTPRDDSPSLKMLPGGALNGGALAAAHAARDAAAHEGSHAHAHQDALARAVAASEANHHLGGDRDMVMTPVP